MNDPAMPPPESPRAPAAHAEDDGLTLDVDRDDGLYGVAEPEPAPTAAPSSVTLPEWYVAAERGQREGPIGLAEVRQRLTSGRMGPETLVWRSGMAGWVAARTVPELFDLAGGPGGAPPLPPHGRQAASRSSTAAEVLRSLDDFFSRPGAYRLGGRVCAAVAAVIFVVSLLLWYWKITWFTGAVFFAMIFVLGEAAGAILEKLGRVESKLQGRSAD